MDDQVLNERLALLLGWTHELRERHPAIAIGPNQPRWRGPNGEMPDFMTGNVPDFLNDWTRFPELQAYVRGLIDSDLERANDICEALDEMMGPDDDDDGVHEALAITPRILGMSILEVCGSEVEEAVE